MCVRASVLRWHVVWQAAGGIWLHRDLAALCTLMDGYRPVVLVLSSGHSTVRHFLAALVCGAAAAAASTQAAKWLTSFNEGYGVPAHALRAKICLCCTRRRVPGNKALVFLHLSWPGSLRIANHL